MNALARFSPVVVRIQNIQSIVLSSYPCIIHSIFLSMYYTQPFASLSVAASVAVSAMKPNNFDLKHGSMMEFVIISHIAMISFWI